MPALSVPAERMRILFFVRSLHIGGAERQLVELARGLQAGGHEVAAAVFYAGGRTEAELHASHIPVFDLRKRGRWELARFLARVAAVVREYRPDVLHSYMEANLFAAVLKPRFPRVKVVWGIRSAKTQFADRGRIDRIYPRLERIVSRLPDGIIVNSTAARHQVLRGGVDPSKVAVVPNGIDCQTFHPDPEGRARVRALWGIGAGERVVGTVARLDPVKNHPNFIRAAARVAAVRDDVRFACVCDAAARPGYRRELAELADSLGLAGRFTWVDDGKVSSAVYSAMDVVALSSNVGESFPNVLAEAMACGKPTVTTDSGDAAMLVGEPGAVAPPQDDEALARAMLFVLERLEPGVDFSQQQRARITGSFSVDLLAARTVAALESFAL